MQRKVDHNEKDVGVSSRRERVRRKFQTFRHLKREDILGSAILPSPSFARSASMQRAPSLFCRRGRSPSEEFDKSFMTEVGGKNSNATRASRQSFRKNRTP